MRFVRRDWRDSLPARGASRLPKMVVLAGALLALGLLLNARTSEAQGAPSQGEGKAKGKAAARPAKAAKYYFNVKEIRSTVAGEDVKATAREILANDLAGRPQFTSDLEGAGDPEALVAELRRRKLSGFLVTMNIEKLTREPRPPKPDGRLPQLSVAVKLSVFGTTIPEAKLAFGGDGEAEIVAEVVERRMEEETAALTKDVLVQAVKQAVDQAVAKLSMPLSKPFNESKRRRPKGPQP